MNLAKKGEFGHLDLSIRQTPVPERLADRESRLTKSVCARMSSPNSRNQRLIIQDISRFGIRGKADNTPLVGENISVKMLDGQLIYLKVRWVKADVFGAQADSPINLNQIGVD